MLIDAIHNDARRLVEELKASISQTQTRIEAYGNAARDNRTFIYDQTADTTVRARADKIVDDTYEHARISWNELSDYRYKGKPPVNTRDLVLAEADPKAAKRLLDKLKLTITDTRVRQRKTENLLSLIMPAVKASLLDVTPSDSNGFKERMPETYFGASTLNTACEITCPTLDFSGFRADDLPTSTEIDFTELNKAIAAVSDGTALGKSFTSLMDAGRPHIESLLTDNRINYETYAKYLLDLIGLAMQSAVGASTAAVDAEVKKITTQISLAELALRRATTGSEIIIQQQAARIDLKSKYAQSIIEIDAGKVALRDKQLTGWWDRKLKASGITLKNKQAELFDKQINGFDSKKQNELFKHLLDVWTITATEELRPEWRFSFTDRTKPTPTTFGPSQLEKWLKKYVGVTPNVGP